MHLLNKAKDSNNDIVSALEINVSQELWLQMLG